MYHRANPYHRLVMLASACICLPVVATAADEAPWPMHRGDAGATGLGTRVGPAVPATVGELRASIRCDPVAGPTNLVFLGQAPGPSRASGWLLKALSPSLHQAAWQVKIGHEPAGLALHGDLLYVATRGGTALALDREDGATLAETSYADEDEWRHYVHPPVVSPDGNVYLGTVGKVQAFSPGLRRRLWTWDSPVTSRKDLMYLGPAALTVDGLVLVAHSRGSLFALSSETGELRWEFSTGEMSLPEGLLVAESDGSVFWVGNTGPYECALFCLGADGRVRWSMELPDGLPSGIAAEGSRIIYLDHNGHLLCLDDGDGSVVWQRALQSEDSVGAAFEAAPVLDPAGSLFVAGRGLVLAYDIATGAERWRVGVGGALAVRSLMLGSEGWLYALCSSGIYAINDAE